ncbi:MAG: SusC/RagA family TonB-linked outer membrane protein [Ferruginibacter sp.]|nr:SusC/RagA family TonB-linked outer membrane protein [Ferruginibacter sp.]
MRRFLSLFAMLMLCGALAYAQNRVVSGKVVDVNGKPVPFASVLIKGKNTGVQTDANGDYTIRVNTGDVLTISQASYLNNEVTVGAGNSITTSLVLKENTITEVVITSAYNRKTTARGATTNAQVVGSEQLNTIRQTNLNSALAGKVSGTQFRGQSTAKLGTQTNVRLRGENAFGGGSGVLYVVDGTILPNANDISLDDIEDVSVLQGPNAAALFGPEGANGAIVISTKRARKNQKGIGVEVNMGVQFDKVYIMPNYQNSYAGGDFSDMQKYTYKAGDPEGWKALDGKYFPDYSEDVSWGPRIAGQEYIPWYAWYPGHERAFKTDRLVAHPENAKQYFQTGQQLNNNINFSKASDAGTFRASFGNVDVKGLIPTTYLKRYSLNMNSSYNITSKLILGLNVNYITQTVNGEFDDAYSNATSGSFNQWFHRELDMNIVRELKDLRSPTGVLASWNHSNPNTYSAGNPKAFYGAYYWYNPFTWMDNISNINRNDRLYGNVDLTYKFNSDFSITGTYRKQQNTTFSEYKESSEIEEAAVKTGELAAYATGTTFSNRENFQVIGNYTKKIRDFGVNASAGLDIFHALSKSNSANTNGGFNVRNLFTIGNSKNPATYANGRSEERRRGIFATATFDYKNMFFVDGTIRRDYFSSLPQENPSILSKAAGVSFVFSDLVKTSLPFISYGKIRASYGEVPQSIDPYLYPGFAYGVGANQWNGNFLMATPDQVVDPSIKGAVAQQKEVGVDLRFLKNRVGFSVTYYDSKSSGFPTAAPQTQTSGFTSLLTNVGEIQKNGVDVQFNVKPVWNTNFKWDLNATWGYLINNKVVDLNGKAGDTAAQFVQRVWTGASGSVSPGLYHEEGQQWGQIYGAGIKRINGVPVLDADGFYVTDPKVFYGSVLPRYTGGIQNSFTLYKNFTINANIDFQSGGKFVSLSDAFGSSSGLTARTAELNDRGIPMRDPVSAGGGKHVVGVDASGKPVDYYVDARSYYTTMFGRNQYDEFIYDLTYVKLRELSIGYNIPVDRIGNIGKKITRASFSIVARNPVLIYAKSRDFDPSEVSNIDGERGGLPGTRGMGFNLKLGF